MLGFSSVSETTFAQAATALFASAFTSSVAAAGQITAMVTHARANETIVSTSLSVLAEPLADVDAQAVTDFSSVSASSALDAFQSVFGPANTTPTSVLVTSSVEDFASLTGFANTTTPSAPASILNNTFADVDAKANKTLSSVAMALNIRGYSDEDAEANTTLTSVAALLSLTTPTRLTDDFDYASIASQYNRSRTLVVRSGDNNNVVYITK